MKQTTPTNARPRPRRAPISRWLAALLVLPMILATGGGLVVQGPGTPLTFTPEAQAATATAPDEQASVVLSFHEYDLDANALADRISASGRLTVPYAEGTVNLTLHEEVITFAGGRNVYVTRESNGPATEHPFTGRFFQGTTADISGGKVRLLLDGTGIYGTITVDDDAWSLQPLRMATGQAWPDAHGPLASGHVYQEVRHKSIQGDSMLIPMGTEHDDEYVAFGSFEAFTPSSSTFTEDQIQIVPANPIGTVAEPTIAEGPGTAGIAGDLPVEELCLDCEVGPSQNCLPDCIPATCIKCILPDCIPYCVDPGDCPPDCADPPCLNCIDPLPCDDYVPAGSPPDPGNVFCQLPGVPCPVEDQCIYWPDPCGEDATVKLCVAGNQGPASLLLQIMPYAEPNYVLYASDWYDRIASAYYVGHDMWQDANIQLGWWPPEETGTDMWAGPYCGGNTFDSGLRDFVEWVQPELHTDRNVYQIFTASFDPDGTTIGCGSAHKLSNHENTNNDRLKAMSAVTAKDWDSVQSYGIDVYDPDSTHDLSIVAMHELTHNAGSYGHYQDRKNWCNYNVISTGVPVYCQELWRATGAIIDVRNYTSTVLCNPC